MLSSRELRQAWQSALNPQSYAVKLLSEADTGCAEEAIMSGPVVEIQLGKVRGSVERSIEGDDYFSFKGLPYAKPPLGQLRFAVS